MINEGGATLSNFRENLRIRKLMRDIEAADAELERHNMEEMAKAKRNFEEQYPIKKQAETEMQSQVTHRLTI